MTQRIFSALKQFVLTRAIRMSPARAPRAMDMVRPEPIRQPLVQRMPEIDEMLFETAPVSALQHRMDMLSNDMDRLSGTLSGLRSFLGAVTKDAPMMAAVEVSTVSAPMIADDVLFEGEPMVASPNAISAKGEADFLFEDDAPVLRPLEDTHPRLTLDRAA